MPTAVVIAPNLDAPNLVDDAVSQARRAFDDGVRQIWLAQMFDYDAITLAALIGVAVPGLTVGTSVVPLNPRHPLVIASAAQTAQAATHGNFVLGVGLGAHHLEQQAFGISPGRTVTRLREHLTVLRAVFHDGAVEVHGEEITAAPTAPVRVAGGTPIPVYVAAMGPKALAVTGELADGTLPFLAGPRTIEDFIEPALAKAAADAGRPRPEIIAMVPVLVTDDVDTGRDHAAQRLSFYDEIPSYQKVVAREGLSSAADLAIVGSAAEVRRGLQRYRDAGATEVALSPVRHDDIDTLRRIWAVTAEF